MASQLQAVTPRHFFRSRRNTPRRTLIDGSPPSGQHINVIPTSRHTNGRGSSVSTPMSYPNSGRGNFDGIMTPTPSHNDSLVPEQLTSNEKL